MMPEPERLWCCPECGVVVEVTEALAPVYVDMGSVVEMKLHVIRFHGMDRMLRRFRVALPILRLACWIADMGLEVEDGQGTGDQDLCRMQEGNH